MRYVAALTLTGWLGGFISQTSADPISTFAPLGITGVVSIILYLWRQETAKKLDKATELNEKLVPLMTRVLDVVQASNRAHEKSAEAMTGAAEALARVPSEETFTRIKVALERSERSWAKAHGLEEGL